MCLKQEQKNFWDRNAGRYDRFMRKDGAAYDEMYALIRPVVKAKTVLRLATGTVLRTSCPPCVMWTTHPWSCSTQARIVNE